MASRAARVSAALSLLVVFSVCARLQSDPARSAIGSHSPCAGHERWQIKTLTDATDAGQPVAAAIDFANPLRTTIAELRANETRPAKVSRRVGRIRPVEFTLYRLRATLREAKGEPDGDIHLVIEDGADSANSMVVEFPDTRCEPQKSSFKASSMRRAKRSFLQFVMKCAGTTPSFTRFTPLVGRVTIKGVGFWDIKHATPQRGGAPNNIELHPVLSFTRGVCPS